MSCDTLIDVQSPPRRDPHQRQEKIRIIVADDHDLVREGLWHVFRGTQIEIVGEAATVDDAIRLALDTECDLVLLDLSWPNGQRTRPRGFDILRAIKTSKPDLPVLVHSMHDRESYKNRCRGLGASGYIVKGTSNVKLVQEICRCGRYAETQT
jgi:DNA-binding NarL/FixJ family response regulator